MFQSWLNKMKPPKMCKAGQTICLLSRSKLFFCCKIQLLSVFFLISWFIKQLRTIKIFRTTQRFLPHHHVFLKNLYGDVLRAVLVRRGNSLPLSLSLSHSRRTEKMSKFCKIGDGESLCAQFPTIVEHGFQD